MKKLLPVAVAVVLLCGALPASVSAAPPVKEGAKCSKVGAKVKVSKSVTFVCTSYGTKKKVLKWKRVVTTTTVPTTTAVTSTVPNNSTTAKIVIKGYSYVVASGIKKGDVLSISNQDSVTHTVTFDPNAIDIDIGGGYSVKKSQVELSTIEPFNVSVSGNSTATLPPLGVGKFIFYCTIHTTMKGTLIIG